MIKLVKITMPLLCAVALLCVGCDEAKPDQSSAHDELKESVKFRGQTMGTYWQVTLAHPIDTEQSATLQNSIENTLKAVNQDMSTYITDSAISIFNNLQDKKPYSISPAFMKNILAAQSISEASDGVYDITIGPLVNLWGFGPDKIKQAPSQAAIDDARAKVGYQQLIVDEAAGTIAKSNPQLMIDLSSIAKGYGVDAVSALLSNQGYQDFLVDIGGELLARGSKFGEPWRVAIEQPVNGRHVQQVIELNEKTGTQTAMATSGNYRNYIDYEGLRAVHTIDPRTGRSSQSNLLSVTVIAKECMYADGYATAMMALGENDAEDFARVQNLAALFIYADKGNTKKFIVVKSPAWLKQFGE